jgi:signal transduction histidine kinase
VTLRGVWRAGGLAIEVSDQGAGIPEADRERIFEPFYTTKEQGSGLGLAVAANIAAQHGGLLSCESGQGRGVTFRLELPGERPSAVRS